MRGMAGLRRGAGILTLVAALSVPPAGAGGLVEALAGGKPHLDLRARYEAVDDRVRRDARAGTLRTRLGYVTGAWLGLSGYGEFEDVRLLLGLGAYAPREAGRATVADPPVTQLNQAYLQWRGPRGLRMRLGRQRIVLDNHRFVGNVGWRQNEQTFDALRLELRPWAGVRLNYAFVDKVNGILPALDADVSDHLLHLLLDGLPAGRLSLYAYLLEDDRTGASSDTYGARLEGGWRRGTWRLPYAAEAAWQRADAGQAPYLLLKAGLARGPWRLALAWERLGSDGRGYALQTPLATKHAFNGWADQFLATPADGLQDLAISAGWRDGPLRLLAVHRRYRADQGQARYGSEWNLLLTRALGHGWAVGVKYAAYRAEAWRQDVDKLWLWGELRR